MRFSVVPFLMILNGLYDLVCSLSIVLKLDNTFSDLHTDMFIDRETSKNDKFTRMMACWICTYGCIRIYAGLDKRFASQLMCAASYAIEAIYFEYECTFEKTVHCPEAHFVSTCSVLAVMVIFWNEL